MSKEVSKEVERLKREVENLKLELALRTIDTTFLVTIPKEHQKHGQHTAFQSGVENAWRGRTRSNPYCFGNAQYLAWESGFKLGAQAFAEAVVKETK